jgi:anaerobic magnesium-protoporphyrin IX monomethyl ester cyclase
MNILGLNPPSRFSKNVARDLLWGCWCRGKRIAGVQFPPLPLLYVATVLKQAGHTVTVLDAQARGKTPEDVESVIPAYDLVFMISATMSYAEDMALIGRLKKKNPRLIAIVFGAHATFLPRQALQYSEVDIIVRHEAEFCLHDLVNALSRGGDAWKQVPGIGYREDGRPHVNPPYPYIDDLDAIPFPDRSLLPDDLYYYNPVIKQYPWATLLSSRGCPGRCTFCTSPGYYGTHYRYRSAVNVVNEIEALAAAGMRELFFRDEVFTGNVKRVYDICRLIGERNISMSWICSVKANTLEYDMLKVMKKAGCRMIRIGVESGVQELLDAVNKDVAIEKTAAVFSWARELGLETHAHVMLGLPGETDDTVRRTFGFINRMRPSTVTYGIMTPYPGTPIYEQVLACDRSYGDGTRIDAGQVHTNASFSRVFTDIPRQRLERYVREGYRRFYMRGGYVFERLINVRDLHELRRLALAGMHVFDFIVRGD